MKKSILFLIIVGVISLLNTSAFADEKESKVSKNFKIIVISDFDVSHKDVRTVEIEFNTRTMMIAGAITIVKQQQPLTILLNAAENHITMLQFTTQESYDNLIRTLGVAGKVGKIK